MKRKGPMATNRREFLRMGAAAVAMPLFGIGCAGFGCSRTAQLAAGAPIRVGLVAAGGFMKTLMCRLGRETNVEFVAMCDPDRRTHAELRRRLGEFYGNRFDFSRTRDFADYREMFEACGDELDAVFIAAPNHHHALAAILAIRRGIHVYIEKPLAHTFEEVLQIEREAKRFGVVVQVGNYGHCTDAMHELKKAVAEGAIGEVTDAWSFSDRMNSIFIRPQKCQPPSFLDFDLWCGPSPICDYYGVHDGQFPGLHPHDWHNWIDYGNGSIGNMGTHVIDAPYTALGLWKVKPERIDVVDVKWAAPGAWACRDSIDFRFPAHDGFGPITLHWRDGVKDGIAMDAKYMNTSLNMLHRREWTNFPEELVELERKYGVRNPIPKTGSVIVGTKGMVYWEFHSLLRFYPEDGGRKDMNVDKMGWQGERVVEEFLGAIRGRARNSTGLEFSAPLAKTLMLGNMASFAGKGAVLGFDGEHVTGSPAAEARRRVTYRKGWEVS